MRDKVTNLFNSMDNKVKKIMKEGLMFCFVLAIISSLFLLTYDLFYSSIIIYYIGFYILKNSILFACTFLAFGIGFNRIKKEME